MRAATDNYVVRGTQVLVKVDTGSEEPLGRAMPTRAAAISHARMLAGADGTVKCFPA